jgi:hypothetical protein
VLPRLNTLIKNKVGLDCSVVPQAAVVGVAHQIDHTMGDKSLLHGF